MSLLISAYHSKKILKKNSLKYIPGFQPDNILLTTFKNTSQK